MGKVRPTDQQIQAYSRNAFDQMDADGDGCITKQEFLDYSIKNKKQPEYSSNLNFGSS
jgi:Ca2+-binding EF-hand superfamily protein